MLQFVDAWTNNFAYIGRRATGTAAGDFLLAPPGYAGRRPRRAAAWSSAVDIFAIVGRMQVNGVRRPAGGPRAAGPVHAPAVDRDTGTAPACPVPDHRVGDDLAWWERFRVALAAFPPPAGDAPFLAGRGRRSG